jgi:hypothetical protein
VTDLFSLPELAAFLQRDLDTSSATLAREIATGLIEAEIGVVTEKTSTVTLSISCDGRIDLPSPVVTDVASVTVGGAAATFEWQRPYPRLQLTSWSPTAGTTWQSADVTFTHGYPTVPTKLKAIALAVAARAYDNPQGATGRQVDDYVESGLEAGITLTDHELTSLERFAGGSYTTAR